MGLSFLRKNDIFHISKHPGIKSCSVFFGILSLGLGAAYYGSENIAIKCLYLIGCFVVAASCLDSWEDCIFDRSSREVTLRKATFYGKIFGWLRSRDVVISMDNIMSLRVDTISLGRSSGRSVYNVALILRSGMTPTVLESALTNTKSECELIASKISSFLQLNHMESVDSCDLEDSNYFSDRESSSSDSENKEPCTNYGVPRQSVTLVTERR